jgi:hypothetical protein
MYSARYSCPILVQPEFDSFSKNPPVSNFMKTRPLEAEISMWTDGWTDMTKLMVAFRSFAIAPKKKKSRENRTAVVR